jgi:hypothetical protein
MRGSAKGGTPSPKEQREERAAQPIVDDRIGRGEFPADLAIVV